VPQPGWELRLLASEYHGFDCIRCTNGGESDLGWAGKRRWLQFQRLTCAGKGGAGDVGSVGKVDAARVAGYSAAKSGDSISAMPALQQIGGIEFLLLAA